MAKNVVRNFGEPQHGTTKNVASAKTSGTLIPFPLTQAAGNPVALLTKDAATSEDGVPCLLGGVVVEYACLSTDVGDPGAQMYYDNSGTNRLTTTASTHNKAGRLAKTKLNGETTAQVNLNQP
jgi:hypothetical protein